MTDLEMTRLCAEAMGFQRVAVSNVLLPGFHARPPFVSCSYTGTSMDVVYEPLLDDKQAMALVKRFFPVIEPDPARSQFWGITIIRRGEPTATVRHAPDLNGAIVACVAYMQAAKAKP